MIETWFDIPFFQYSVKLLDRKESPDFIAHCSVHFFHFKIDAGYDASINLEAAPPNYFANLFFKTLRIFWKLIS